VKTETEVRPTHRDSHTADDQQKEFVRTMYSSDLTKKSNKFIEENDLLINKKTRNGDICYFRDILTQYKRRKYGYFKLSDPQIDENNQMGKTSTKILQQSTKNKSKIDLENVNSQQKLEEKRSGNELKFSNTMDNYYKSLMSLRVNQYRQPRLSKEVTEGGNKLPMWENKIASLFGIDQHKDNLKQEDLNIFKNLHVRSEKTSQDKTNLPNLINFNRRNTDIKFGTTVKKGIDLNFLKLKSTVIFNRRNTRQDINFFKLRSTMEK
jgi:hypothetical protein